MFHIHRWDVKKIDVATQFSQLREPLLRLSVGFYNRKASGFSD